MNKDKLVEFTRWFEMNTRHHYDQNYCGSCLAAHARYWSEGGKRGKIGTHGDLVRIFELDVDAARDVYMCDSGLVPTQQHAAAMLRHLAETGKVDWKNTKPTLTESLP